MLPALDRANHFYCPAGRWAARGWILLARSDYDLLDPYSTSLQLNLGDSLNSDNVSTLKNLSIVQAQCVTRGLASDPSALYLVELTDGRGILHNQWFQFPTVSAYNIRAPAYPDTFHPASLNSGATWTWSTMLQDLWTQMVARLGAWPGLPYSPAGTPEGFWFTGVSAWTALCGILEHLGLTVACDLTRTSPYTIVKQDAADAAHAVRTAKYLTNLEDDLEWLDHGAGRVPASVRVLFRRRNSVYGTEETVRLDLPQWDMATVYSVSVAAPASVAGGVGVHHLWSDFTVRYDMDGSPVAADVTTAVAIAAERAAQYYASINPGNYVARTYAGALPFVTGSQVDGVSWCMGDEWGGWRTQVVYGPAPPWPELWD